ncbi:MAG TPA: hypothetical protein VKU02_26445 [Gemmataceae bacterium]|nr:hypothetical protein [Gemmataceae bacterium]
MPRLEPLEDRTVLSTLTVTNPADSGDGSLRAAIALAQSGDQIAFDTSLKGQTITLTSGQLAITQRLDIEGPGAGQLAVSGNHASQIFAVSGGVTVTIPGLTLTDGMVAGNDGGGAVLNSGSSLTLAKGGNGLGGALYVAGGTASITHTAVGHNKAVGGNGSGVAIKSR